MYALAIIRYRRPLEEVLAHHDAHRAYLQELKVDGRARRLRPARAALRRRPAAAGSGRCDRAALDAVRDGDPYWKAGVGQYELLAWDVQTGRDDLDRA